MKVDCQWISANLEAFFCETLGAEESQLASEHVKTCVNCSRQIQALQDADPLIQQLFDYRMTTARAAANAPRRSIGFHLGLAGGAVAVIATLVFSVFLYQSRWITSPPPASQIAQEIQNLEAVKDPKAAPSISIERAKPDAPDLKAAAGKPAVEPVIPDGAPEFLVTDPAGYSTSLQDYRGRVLLLGVWSEDQPEAAKNLQRLYQAFGTRHEVRILGVSSRNESRLPGTTFPMYFNNGSKLLDTHNSNFAIVDKEGHVQMRGSLAGDANAANALIARIRAKLDEMGSR